jgi:hypothetical protein
VVTRIIAISNSEAALAEQERGRLRPRESENRSNLGIVKHGGTWDRPRSALALCKKFSVSPFLLTRWTGDKRSAGEDAMDAPPSI